MTEHEHPPKNTPGKKPAQNEVAKKAYAIYLKKGCPQGLCPAIRGINIKLGLPYLLIGVLMLGIAALIQGEQK